MQRWRRSSTPPQYLAEADALWSRPLKPPQSHRRAAGLVITPLLYPGSHRQTAELFVYRPDFVPLRSISAAFYLTMAGHDPLLRILPRGVPSDVCTLIYTRFALPYTFVYPLPIHHLCVLNCVPDYTLLRPFCFC
jgi:hypothetical protein